uniref:Uncharacterized protein n=1 Tax=Acrobeloides nanus TaxID=290746 RepID=A0A914DRZ1_9BILA
MNDLDKMEINNMTSYVENYHSVVIKFRPKIKYFPKIGFMRRTMLAAMAYNENREAEIRGDKRVSVVYQSFSKAKGERVTKMKKSPSNENWKQEIVEKSIERKQAFGTGNPIDQDDSEDLDIIVNQFIEMNC